MYRSLYAGTHMTNCQACALEDTFDLKVINTFIILSLVLWNLFNDDVIDVFVSKDFGSFKFVVEKLLST